MVNHHEKPMVLGDFQASWHNAHPKVFRGKFLGKHIGMYNSCKATGRLKAITRLVWLRHVSLGFFMTLVVWERKAHCGCESIATLPGDDGYERKNAGTPFLGDLDSRFLGTFELGSCLKVLPFLSHLFSRLFRFSFARLFFGLACDEP